VVNFPQWAALEMAGPVPGTGVGLGAEGFTTDNIPSIRIALGSTLGLSQFVKRRQRSVSCISHLKSISERVPPYSKLLNR